MILSVFINEIYPDFRYLLKIFLNKKAHQNILIFYLNLHRWYS